MLQNLLLYTNMKLNTSLLLLIAIVFTGCSNLNSSKNQESIQLEPENDTLGLSFGINCNKETKIPTFGIKGSIKLENNFTFTTDKTEKSYTANVADDLVVFSAEDSKTILKDIQVSKVLKIKTSSLTAQFNLDKVNQNIQSHIKECL